jgi:hypothetical protein
MVWYGMVWLVLFRFRCSNNIVEGRTTASKQAFECNGIVGRVRKRRLRHWQPLGDAVADRTLEM